MRSSTTRQFRRAFSRLPEQAYRRFVENPNHPGLRFKRIHPTEPIYSARVTKGYRALDLLEDDDMIWFWIGSHADYDELISRL